MSPRPVVVPATTAAPQNGNSTEKPLGTMKMYEASPAYSPMDIKMSDFNNDFTPESSRGGSPVPFDMEHTLIGTLKCQINVPSLIEVPLGHCIKNK